MCMNPVPITQDVIVADRPFMRDWTPRKAGDWICQGKSGAIYGLAITNNIFGGIDKAYYLVMPAPTPKAAACECGVKFTGGLHSDWCPRAGEAA